MFRQCINYSVTFNILDPNNGLSSNNNIMVKLTTCETISESHSQSTSSIKVAFFSLLRFSMLSRPLERRLGKLSLSPSGACCSKALMGYPQDEISIQMINSKENFYSSTQWFTLCIVAS